MSVATKQAAGFAGIVLMAFFVAAVLSLSGCAPQESSNGAGKQSNEAEAATQTVAWSADSDCSTCHEAESKSLEDSSYLCSTHDQQGLSCMSCHADESALSDAHAKAKDLTKTATKLKKTDVDASVCESCHSLSDLQAATADLTLLTDENGKTVNPHDLPANEEHAVIDCASCHSMHTTETADTLAPDKCLSCHHQNVYECHTCHS